MTLRLIVVVLDLDLLVVVVLVRSFLCRSSLVLLLGKGVETYGLFRLLRVSVYRVRVCVCVFVRVCVHVRVFIFDL